MKVLIYILIMPEKILFFKNKIPLRIILSVRIIFTIKTYFKKDKKISD